MKSMTNVQIRMTNECPNPNSSIFGYWIIVISFVIGTWSLVISSCAHPMFEAKEKTTTTVSRAFDTDANEAYQAVRWALKTSGYSITGEDLQNGVVTSGWLPTTVDSHYVDPFGGHRDYGVNGAYFMLEVKIVPMDSGQTDVQISSRVKGMMAHLRSSKVQEGSVLNKVSDYLRKPDIRVTNLGVEE